MNLVTDFYYMRLKITVTPTEIIQRPLPVPSGAALADSGLLGAEVLDTFDSVVLTAAPAGYRVDVPSRYLERRQVARPAVPWADYRAIRSRVRARG